MSKELTYGMLDADNDTRCLTEWKVVPGLGGWEFGWFVCSKCGQKSAEDKEVCPNCNSKMKKIKLY